jgi:hypothetical protein
VAEFSQKALLPYRLTAGIVMVLLAIVWATGWFMSPANLFAGTEAPVVLTVLTSLVLGAWNLIACVIAAGFFHAASVIQAETYRAYRNASLRLVLIGMIFLFPVPLMAQVLGSSIQGRSLALFITGMSIATVIFGRARINSIGERLREYAEAEELPKLAPLR